MESSQWENTHALSTVHYITKLTRVLQVKQDGDNDDGFVFSGAGSAVSTGRNYGGVIYVYTNASLCDKVCQWVVVICDTDIS
jgi:hypothetical protein